MQPRYVLSLFVCLFLLSPNLNAQDAKLAELRNDLARRYFEPEAHMNLAKYIYDKDNKLLAFYILESARRTRFEQEVFDVAFRKHFIGDPFDNASEAESTLLQQYAQKQDDVKVLTKLADIYVSQSNWKQAESYFEKALKLQPDNETAVMAMAEIFRRSGREAQGETFLKTFAAKFPDTKVGMRIKIAFTLQTNQAEAKRLLDAASKSFPDDGFFYFILAGLNQEQKRLAEAETNYVKAANLAKDNPTIQGGAGRFFRVIRKQPEKALEYYLNAYFFDPHFYDGEYAEHWIREFGWNLSESNLKQQLAAKTSLETLSKSANPVIVGRAMDAMIENWKPGYVGLMVDLMSHDDPNIRAGATEALKQKTRREFDPQLKALLNDSDLRKRGLAAYIAVHHWGKDSFELMKQWLKEDAQLIRFDAVSALLMEGGEAGKKIALAHRTQEPHPWLKSLLEKSQ